MSENIYSLNMSVTTEPWFGDGKWRAQDHLIIIIISPTTSKPRRNMGRPLQGRLLMTMATSMARF